MSVVAVMKGALELLLNQMLTERELLVDVERPQYLIDREPAHPTGVVAARWPTGELHGENLEGIRHVQRRQCVRVRGVAGKYVGTYSSYCCSIYLCDCDLRASSVVDWRELLLLK